ncbi:DNA topoisomerase 3-alpha isoform X2 [Contarinia nasturtii]|uniref:DNA topoisomerase 3-alpha isoform X2 n=1 Tax=Contarinia nasturtii TaxID=265458 RepID=UPI0012D3A4D1|nr:DNA topoisomerase 3-alpha isoform X2 [Contarinia nasturtii]
MDCDREGENIGFEIIDTCRAVKPNIKVFRARFSEITSAAIYRALNNVCEPDIRQSQAVDVRTELDLRIGAAFTRFQTLRYQRVFPAIIEKRLVSYGSCQIPTLGFVARRFNDIEKFIPRSFWKLKLTHTLNDLTVEYNWDRHRLFDKNSCEAFLMICQSGPTAKVVEVTQKPKNKWRPQAMDTIELEKLGSRKLKLSAKETMTIAEKLYSNGIISYPRTETNMFSGDIDLKKLVNNHLNHPDWGNFAQRVIDWSPNPRNGKKSDQAHPPIHPLKLATDLQGNEKRVYELICRHFLACVSRDATGSETTVKAVIANEQFTATGLCIHERNYLDVYIYEKWNSKEIHNYQVGNTFEPTELSMPEGSTSPPNLLTEADLIALMDKNGIGTDATHAEHINTIKTRGYIGEIENGYLVPGTLGMGLVEGYDSVELPLAYPELRAGLERDLKSICTGHRRPDEVLREQIEKYKEAYRVITDRIEAIDASLANRLQAVPQAAPAANMSVPTIEPIFKCPKCNKYYMCLRAKKDNNGFFFTCMGKPECTHVIWLADVIKEIKIENNECNKCRNGNKQIVIKFKSNNMLAMLNPSLIDDNDRSYKSCILCDSSLRVILDINPSSLRGEPNPANRSQINRTTPTNPSTYAQPQNNQPPSNRPPLPNPQQNQTFRSPGNVKCSGCNQPAISLTVKKDGPNKGRQFYKCPKQPACNFFEWADASPQNTSFAGQRFGSGGASTSTSNVTRNQGGTGQGQAQARKRKCGNCKQEGHTRVKCPRLNQFNY